MTRVIAASLVVLALALAAPAAQQPGPATQPAAAPAALINLNTATMQQLESLPGVGVAIAQRIIEYREQSGGFQKVEELMNVRGIGERSFLTLRPLVTVTAARGPSAQQE